MFCITLSDDLYILKSMLVMPLFLDENFIPFDYNIISNSFVSPYEDKSWSDSD